MTSLLKPFLILYYIKQIDFKLPCVCSVIDRFLFLPHFDVLCDLLLNRRTATWNLFVKYLVCQAHGYLSLYYNKKTMHWVLKYRVVPLHHSASSAKRFPLAKFCDIHGKPLPDSTNTWHFLQIVRTLFLKDSLSKQLPLTNKLCTPGALRVFFFQVCQCISLNYIFQPKLFL